MVDCFQEISKILHKSSSIYNMFVLFFHLNGEEQLTINNASSVVPLFCSMSFVLFSFYTTVKVYLFSNGYHIFSYIFF